MSKLDIAALLDVAGEELTQLERYGFDAEAFTRLRAELQRGGFPASRNVETAAIEPPREEDLTVLPPSDSAAGRRLAEVGREAIERGEVAAVILNGGMATRFGGVVKGVVEVFEGASFLSLRLEDVARTSPSAPAFLMDSFATDADTRKHLADHGWFGLSPERAQFFVQRISVRLTPNGEVFRDRHGRTSLYSPGHGDVFTCLAACEGFRRFVAAGGKQVLISNVDNIGATLSPLVIGAHRAGGKSLTIEVAERAHGDRGGAPARIRGRVEVLEGFRFPPDLDLERFRFFSTNTLIVDVSAVRPDYALTWYRADKEVDGRPAVQFERLMGEVSMFCDATYLIVPREGPEGRFLPVKTPEDLARLRPVLRARTGH